MPDGSYCVLSQVMNPLHMKIIKKRRTNTLVAQPLLITAPADVTGIQLARRVTTDTCSEAGVFQERANKDLDESSPPEEI